MARRGLAHGSNSQSANWCLVFRKGGSIVTFLFVFRSDQRLALSKQPLLTVDS